jgi:hypothetical protein
MRYKTFGLAAAAAALTATAWLAPSGSAAAAGIGEPAGAGGVRVVSQSAFGCNLNTCIEIDGSGTTVTAIFGETKNPGSSSITTTGSVLDNGTVIHTFPKVTLSPGATITQEWASPSYHFHSGDQVCVKYSGIAGEPCETIG